MTSLWHRLKNCCKVSLHKYLPQPGPAWVHDAKKYQNKAYRIHQ